MPLSENRQSSGYSIYASSGTGDKSGRRLQSPASITSRRGSSKVTARTVEMQLRKPMKIDNYAARAGFGRCDDGFCCRAGAGQTRSLGLKLAAPRFPALK
jgi:hypothetical protein